MKLNLEKLLSEEQLAIRNSYLQKHGVQKTPGMFSIDLEIAVLTIQTAIQATEIALIESGVSVPLAEQAASLAIAVDCGLKLELKANANPDSVGVLLRSALESTTHKDGPGPEPVVRANAIPGGCVATEK